MVKRISPAEEMNLKAIKFFKAKGIKDPTSTEISIDAWESFLENASQKTKVPAKIRVVSYGALENQTAPVKIKIKDKYEKLNLWFDAPHSGIKEGGQGFDEQTELNE